MTETEKKALALLNEVQMEMHGNPGWYEGCNRTNATPVEALCRAIEKHEAYKQDVSATLIDEYGEEFCRDHSRFARFIIAKPDPLVEVINDADDMVRKPDAPSYAEAIRAALAARGLEIREKQP